MFVGVLLGEADAVTAEAEGRGSLQWRPWLGARRIIVCDQRAKMEIPVDTQDQTGLEFQLGQNLDLQG